MSGGHEQRPRALVAIDGRQYPRKSPMYIDVLGLSSVSEAVHGASRMLRIGIMQAMANGIDNDDGTTDNHDRLKNQTDLSHPRNLHGLEKEHSSVYSSVTKRARRPKPGATETSSQQLNPQQLDDASSTPLRGKFAPRNWSAAKKAGPSILSKRNRASTVSANVGAGAGNLSVFQPGPKREKNSDTSTKDSKHAAVPHTAENQGAVGSGSAMGEGSARPVGSSHSTKHETGASKTGGNLLENSISGVRTTGSSAANALRSSHTMLKNVQTASAVKETSASRNIIAKPQGASLNPGARKVGLPPSWCQVSAKSFNNNLLTQSTSALSLLRKSETGKQGKLPEGPRESSGLPTVPLMKRAGRASLLSSKSGKPLSDNRGLIPLPSSTGIKVKYVPGSEIIDGVRPNGYTVSIDGVVKPVVTFNPKPKLPHKLRQTSVEKLFEAWRDNRKIVEGDALARALRAEQEMYARATSRADYRAAVMVKLKDVRKVDN